MTLWGPVRPLLLAAAVASACHGTATTPPGPNTGPASEHAGPAPAADPQTPASVDPGQAVITRRGVEVGGATITVVYDGRELPIDDAEAKAWVARSASMVSDYLGGFPVPSLEVTLVGRGGGGVGFGMHRDGRWITVYCGRRTSTERLEDDWVLVHEMLHAAFPDLRREHRWMQEGLSTYLEPIVRARAGNITEERVWQRFTRSLHHGRPRAGDRGLDQTHTWGRTYWGGAVFWLVVDVELRERTDNKKSIRDVVVALLAEGGNGRANWSTERVIEIGDAATGTSVMREVYDAQARAPGDTDLEMLYAMLGIARYDREVFLDDDAPLAHIRRAITRP